MKNKIIISLLVVVTMALLSFYLFLRDQKPRLSTMPIGGDFTIPSTKGMFKLKEKRGKVVILYFGYTFCPDICPTTLATLGALLKTLPEKELKLIETIFISVDPQRDDLKKLKEYVSFFSSLIIGATDTPENIAKLARKYGVAYEKYYPQKADPYYTIDHSTQAFIINKEGKVVELIRHAETAEQIQTKINKFL